MEENNKNMPIKKSQPHSKKESTQGDKTVNEETKQSEKAEKECEEGEVVLPPEQKVLIMACLNPTVTNYINKIAKKNKVEVVNLEEKIIWDYIERKKKETVDSDSLNAFLSNVSNKIKAREHAVHLWQILTGGDNITNADRYVFKRTDVVHKTNLSHSKANNLLQLIHAFSYIEFVNKNSDFKFIFNEETQRKILEQGILSVCKVIKSDLINYQNLVNQSDDITEDKKQILREQMKEFIRNEIGI